MSSRLWVAYVGIHLGSAVLAAGLAYWSVIRTQMRAKRWFGALMLGLSLWSLVAAGELVFSSGSVPAAIKVPYLAVGLTVPLLWVVFTARYTHRRVPSNSVVRALGAVYVVVVLIVLTNPLHELYGSVVFHGTPFPHLELESGPARLLGIAYTLVSMGLGTYYLGSLFERGRSQVSTPTAVLAGVVLLGVIPFLGSLLGFVPISTYNHTPFGISVFLLGVGYIVFRHDFYDISPIARDLVLDEIDDAMIVLDDAARLVDRNTAATELLPELSQERIGTPLRDIDSDLAALIGELDPDQRRELSLSVDGESRHFSVQRSDITRDAEVIGTVAFLRDITRRRKRAQQLEKQNQRLDRFASMVSHDLRNPLNIAQLRTERIAKDRQDANVEGLQDALTRMETMIEDMLRLARAGQDIEGLEEHLLSDLVTDAWAGVRTGDSEVDSHLGDATIEADVTRLTQLLENLVRNAIEHNEAPVVVEVGRLETTPGFYVADDGDGIPPDERDEIFDDGYTTSETGTGLGLAIVREIVDAHDWQIRVTESADGGARFEIRTD